MESIWRYERLSKEWRVKASLVTSQSLTTRFTVPAAGQYTIGVFHIFEEIKSPNANKVRQWLSFSPSE